MQEKEQIKEVSEVDININQRQILKHPMLVPGSILIGALLLCGSVFYNAHKLDKKLTKISESTGSVATFFANVSNQQQGQGGQQAPAAKAEIKDREDAPVIGNKNAKVTIYEFSDFQCPFCKRFYNDAYKKIKSEYIDTGKVKLIFRHYPLAAIHKNAEMAGVASECANRQGKFEAYHNMLFEKAETDGTGLADADLKKYADSLGLNSGSFGLGKGKFDACFKDPKVLEIVKADLAVGNASGVSGTPTLFVNGNPIVGALPFESFKTVIESELAK